MILKYGSLALILSRFKWLAEKIGHDSYSVLIRLLHTSTRYSGA